MDLIMSGQSLKVLWLHFIVFHMSVIQMILLSYDTVLAGLTWPGWRHHPPTELCWSLEYSLRKRATTVSLYHNHSDQTASSSGLEEQRSITPSCSNIHCDCPSEQWGGGPSCLGHSWLCSSPAHWGWPAPNLMALMFSFHLLYLQKKTNVRVFHYSYTQDQKYTIIHQYVLITLSMFVFSANSVNEACSVWCWSFLTKDAILWRSIYAFWGRAMQRWSHLTRSMAIIVWSNA